MKLRSPSSHKFFIASVIHITISFHKFLYLAVWNLIIKRPYGFARMVMRVANLLTTISFDHGMFRISL